MTRLKNVINRHASYVEWVVVRFPAMRSSNSGPENPFRRNWCRIISTRLTVAPRSPAADAVRPSLMPKESTMVLEEEERRMQVPVILETKAALAILEKL